MTDQIKILGVRWTNVERTADGRPYMQAWSDAGDPHNSTFAEVTGGPDATDAEIRAGLRVAILQHYRQPAAARVTNDLGWVL